LDADPEKETSYLYEDYKKMFLNKDKDDDLSEGLFSSRVTVGEKEKAEILYAAYESYQLVKYVEDIKRRTDRPILVVGNLSYGAFVIDPVIERLKGMGVDVIKARIGSTECHMNPYYIKTDLFEEDVIAKIANEQPIVIVVDGTIHIDARLDEGKRGRYPDAHTGYRNYLIAIVDFLSNGNAHLHADSLGVSMAFVKKIRKTLEYDKILEMIKSKRKGDIDENIEQYSMGFWNPSMLPLTIRYKRAEVDLVGSLPDNMVDGPMMIFANVVVPDEYLPRDLRYSTMGTAHDPAYFDDKAHILKFKFSIDERGIHVGTTIRKHVQDAYDEEQFEQLEVGTYKETVGEKEDIVIDQQERDKLSKALERDYRAVAFDFDNTVAIHELMDPKIVFNIVGLLKKGVHVAVISGKGRKLQKIIGLLKEFLDEDQDALKYFHVYSHSGSRGYNALDGDNKLYYEHNIDRSDAREIERIIIEEFEEADKIRHLKKSEKIINVHMTEEGMSDLEDITFALNRLLKAKDMPFKSVGSQFGIDIIRDDVDKGVALRDLSNKAGIPINDIIKVGDLGRRGRNDFEMLIGEGAFSVDETEPETSQISVKAATGLSRIAATRWLFTQINFIGEKGEIRTSSGIDWPTDPVDGAIIPGGESPVIAKKVVPIQKVSQRNPGGIDFNPTNLNLEQKGKNVGFQFNNKSLQNINPDSIQGIVPVIINITPIINFAPLLGEIESEDSMQLSSLWSTW